MWTMKDSEELNPFINAQFVKGIIGTDDVCTDDSRLQVAFVGRSNVGKSSLVNAVLGRKNLVRSSSRPGKTTEINFFSVDDRDGAGYYFVDLPGYGFARMGEKQREKLRKLILWYIMYAGVTRRKTCVVLDAQVGVTDFDTEIITLLVEQGEEVAVIANKIDRLNQKAQAALRQELDQVLGEQVTIIYTSTTKKRGIVAVQQYIQQ